MQVNLYIIFIFHFWKQTREGKIAVQPL